MTYSSPVAPASNTLFGESAYFGYTVRIDAFEGPLDLLLHLIKKNEMDICDIPIATITRQYLEYLEIMKEHNLEIAGEFLVMASTLLYIKSRMLLPAVEDEAASDEEELDPREELIKRLLEYQRYKDASAVLAAREMLGRDVFARRMPLTNDIESQEKPEEPLEMELFDLVEAFRRVLAKIPFERFHEVISETISVADRIGRILDIMDERGTVQFDDLFTGEQLTRELAIATFLALLELCRLQSVKVAQISPFGFIWLLRGSRIIMSENEDVRTEM